MHIGPVIAVTDLQRARDFYEDQLGLEGAPSPGGWIVNGINGTVCYLLPDIADAGTASWPQASFRVDDIWSTVRELRARGVEFLGPDELPFALDADGISTEQRGMKVAWMRDPVGSVLTVFSLD